MSGYNKFEQAVGGVLDRFPRLKSVVEAGYQRTSYHLLADSDFECSVHEDVTISAVDQSYGVVDQQPRFVGFFDICPWDSSMERYAVHEPDNGGAGIIVLSDGTATRVGTTQAWNFQQGSRLQWHPTRPDVLLFNDLVDGTPGARLESVNGTVSERYDRPIQAVNPDGEGFLAIEYARLDVNSPGYGYGAGDESSITPPEDDGIWRVSFDGVSELLVSLADLIADSEVDVPHTNHYIHHVSYAPDGERFVFLHRWMDSEHRHTRLCVADSSGTVQELSDNPYISHYCWLDDTRLFLWGGSEQRGRGYHTVDVTSGSFEYVDALDGYGDGHPSISPDGAWIVTDTYPDRTRKRSLFLYHLDTDQVISAGEFFAPFEFDGAVRCDLHPRWSPDGRFVSIDSAHEGIRRSYILDVSAIVDGSE